MKSNLLRVLHAYKAYHPVEAGIPKIIKLIAEGLQLHTHQEVICTHNKFFDVNDAINNIRIHRLGSWGEVFSLPMTFKFPMRFWQLAQHCDIVDYHFPMPWVDLAIFAYLPKSIKLVIHWHSDIVKQKRIARVLQPIIERCLLRADKIIVADKIHLNSPSLRSHKNKCVVIPFGIDAALWQQLSEGEHRRVQLLQDKHKDFVLAVGRLVSYKGFDILINAMKNVDAELIIVGEGPLNFELRCLTEKLNLQHRVHFYGNVDQQQLKCLYHAAKVFVLPSVSENEAFGIVQLEAMACGKPIINTALKSGVPNVARDAKEAITVLPFCIEPLAAALNKLLVDTSFAKHLAENGLRRVNTKYRLDKFLAKTFEVYENI